MAWSEERLRAVFDKTAGRCHVCREKLAFKNHGRPGARGAWQVDHSVARARGGSDHLNNLFPACCECNNRKSDRSTRAARAEAGHGKTRAPLSKAKQEDIRSRNTVGGGLGGAALGGIIAGLPGAVVGGVLGALLGRSMDVE